MTTTFFPKCQFKDCHELAISFSRFCWGHTEREAYLPMLRKEISGLGKPAALNLKKVECDRLHLCNVDLRNSSLSQGRFSSINFIGANLNDSDLIGAHFDNCDFVGSDLVGANLTRAAFNKCSFSHSDLRGACLAEARFYETDFMGALLFDVMLWNADLAGAKHLKRRNFVDLERALKRQESRLSEKNALMACESYRTLKHHLFQKGLPEDASWASYKELTMERKHLFRTRSPRYFPSLIMNILSGYTEKPSRAILSALAIVLLFGFAYYLFNIPQAPGGNLSSHATLWDSLYFSFVTFTTVGYGDLMPKPVVWFRMLVCAEAFCGPFITGLYIFTLTRKYAAS